MDPDNKPGQVMPAPENKRADQRNAGIRPGAGRLGLMHGATIRLL